MWETRARAARSLVCGDAHEAHVVRAWRKFAQQCLHCMLIVVTVNRCEALFDARLDTWAHVCSPVVMAHVLCSKCRFYSWLTSFWLQFLHSAHVSRSKSRPAHVSHASHVSGGHQPHVSHVSHVSGG